MMNESEGTVSARQAADAQTKLRAELGLAPEDFPLHRFIGMMSDEIEQLRMAGRSDAQIADLLSETVGQAITAQEVETYFASAEQRGYGPDAGP